MAEAYAKARYTGYSARKVGQVLEAIRRKDAGHAMSILNILPKRAAVVVRKTLKSAVSNLSVKSGKPVESAQVWVKECRADAGPALKRLHTGSMGRGMPYKHRTCHLTIVVTDELEILASNRKIHGTKN